MYDIRLPEKGLILIPAPSGGGKSFLVSEILRGGPHTFQKPPSRLLIVSKHPNQDAYSKLPEFIETVIFRQFDAKTGLNESQFRSAFNLQDNDKGTRVAVLDDVSFFHCDLN